MNSACRPRTAPMPTKAVLLLKKPILKTESLS